MTRPGPLTAAHRDHFSATADTLALLPIPGASELARTLSCLANTRIPDVAVVVHGYALGQHVHRALLVDTAPDRWLDMVASFSEAEQNEIVADLIGHRLAQAAAVAETLTVLSAYHVPQRAGA